VSQAEEKLSDVPGDYRGAIVSTDSAEAATEENAGTTGPDENGPNEDGPNEDGTDSSGTPLQAEDQTEADTAEDDNDGEGDDLVAQSDIDEPSVSLADLEQEGEIAADYVEGLLDIADLDGDIDMDVEGNRAVVSVVGATLDELVGRRGEVLEALQELTRLAVHRQTGERARLMLDVGGYRERRRAELSEVGRNAADEVKRTGTPKQLAVMTPFERKIVHGAVADVGLRSESEGEEPNRRVVVYPAE
jgi:spoIIIJ-associated protein